MSEIGKKIRDIRRQKGLNQKQVAKIAGISIAAYSNIESENDQKATKSITIDTGKGIAKAFRMSFYDLFEIEGSELAASKNEDQKDQLEELKEKLKKLERTNDLLWDKINVYKKFVFLSQKAIFEPIINRLDQDINSEETEYKRQNLMRRKSDVRNSLNSLFKLYVDMGLITTEEVDKFRIDDDDLILSIIDNK